MELIGVQWVILGRRMETLEPVKFVVEIVKYAGLHSYFAGTKPYSIISSLPLEQLDTNVQTFPRMSLIFWNSIM